MFSHETHFELGGYFNKQIVAIIVRLYKWILLLAGEDVTINNDP